MKYAYIQNGRVHWIAPPDKSPSDFAPGFLEPVPDTANEGDLWDGVTLSAPPPEPVPVPEYVSKIALKYALGAQWSTVKAAINADPALKEDWDLAYRIYRNSPLMTGTAAALGFTDAQIDDIFRAAAQVVV